MHTVQKQENKEHIRCESKVDQVIADDLVFGWAPAISENPVCKLEPKKQHQTKKIECGFNHLA
jgi:hypothetical protein